jgi:hypothetical protein
LETATTFTPATMTREQRSILLYAECCVVDYGGLLEGVRMNIQDIRALRQFQEAGLLSFGRIPSSVIDELRQLFPGRRPTHWVKFTDAAWSLAHAVRRWRAETSASRSRQIVDEALAERAEAADAD